MLKGLKKFREDDRKLDGKKRNGKGDMAVAKGRRLNYAALKKPASRTRDLHSGEVTETAGQGSTACSTPIGLSETYAHGHVDRNTRFYSLHLRYRTAQRVRWFLPFSSFCFFLFSFFFLCSLAEEWKGFGPSDEAKPGREFFGAWFIAARRSSCVFTVRLFLLDAAPRPVVPRDCILF